MLGRPRQVGAVVGAVLAAVLLTGCGGAEPLTVADAPAPNAEVTPPPVVDDDPARAVGGQVTVAPTLSTPGERLADRQKAMGCPPDPEIPEGVDLEDLQTPGLNDAVQVVLRRYDTYERGASGPHGTGLSECSFAGFFTVYRVPGSKKFDAWISGVAHKHKVRVRFVDRKYSLAELEGARAEVKSREAELAAVGARVFRTHPEFVEGCYIVAEVTGDVAAAQGVLADLGDKVRVIGGTYDQPPAM